MNLDKDEKIIKNALNNIYTKESNIKDNVINKLNYKREKVQFKKYAFVVSLFLIIFLTRPIFADTFTSFDRLLNNINNKFEDLFQPVQLISEDNGIKMEVISAMRDDDTIVIYITLQDTEGDRIDETLDLNDSYRIKGINSYTSEIVNYNEKNKTATLRIQGNSNKYFKNKKVEFSLKSFISGENNITSALSNDIFKDNLINKLNSTVKLDMNNIPGGGGDLYQELETEKEIDILEKNNLNIEFKEIEVMNITNMGIINNKLHIQTKWDISKFNNHGFLYLSDNNGEKVNVKEANIYYSFDKDGKPIYGNDYVEYIFDLENVNLDNMNLNAEVSYSETYVEGKWNVKFELEKILEEKILADREILNKLEIDKIKISKLGINIVGNYNIDDLLYIKINMDNAFQKKLDHKIIIKEENESSIKFLSDSPIDINNIKSIDINGDIILFK